MQFKFLFNEFMSSALYVIKKFGQFYLERYDQVFIHLVFSA
jgi:hypothetical protein